MPPALPLSLRVVAWFFIVFGVLACIEVVVSLAQGRVSFNLNVLQWPCGIGLLRLRSGWRTYALVVLWLYIIGLPIALLLILFSQSPVELIWFGRRTGRASDMSIALIVILLAIAWLATICAVRVLVDRRVQVLFARPRQD